LAVAAHQEKEVRVVAEYPACQAMALLHARSVDMAMAESTVGPILSPYRTAADLITSPTMPP
jgi:hypothetical protein